MEPFARVLVDYLIEGGARISWEISPHFIDPGTYTFQLQAGHTGLEDADDWINVGSPVVDTYFTYDLQQRLFGGKTLDLYYRVQLITELGTYYSQPQNCFGLLLKRDWLKAREITRKEKLRHITFTSPNGYLLKARRYGPPCTACTDRVTDLTGEIANSHCPSCYGTGFALGYFAPLPGTYADVGLDKARDKRDPQAGMINQRSIHARFVGDPLLYTYDVWVNATSDQRYRIMDVQTLSQVRGIPLVFDAELRLAAFSDVIYTIPLGIGATKLSRTSKSAEIKVEEVQCLPPELPPSPVQAPRQKLDILDRMREELKAQQARSSRR